MTKVATVKVTAVSICCDLCGSRSVIDGDDVIERAGAWARPHVKPRVMAARHSVDGADHGWIYTRRRPCGTG